MVIFELLALRLPYSDLPPFRITTSILNGVPVRTPHIEFDNCLLLGCIVSVYYWVVLFLSTLLIC